MTSRFFFPAALAGLTLAGTLLLSGPSARSDSKPTPAPAPNTTPAPLVMASDARCQGVRDLMVDTLVYQMVVGYGYGYGYGGYYGGYPMVDAGAAEDSRPATKSSAPAPTPAPAGAGGAAPPQPGPSHYTKTNVQEQGVDEADIVKTDGRHVYTVHGNELVIAKTWPVAKTDVAARVTFQTIYPQQLYLKGDEVIVQGQPTQALAGWNQGRTRVIVVDVKDRRAPFIKKVVDLEGYSQSSRLVGDDLYLVQSSYSQVPQRLAELAQKTIAKVPRADQQTLRPWEVQARLATTLRSMLLSNITQADIDQMLPKIQLGATTKRMACADLYLPPHQNQLGITTLARVSLDDSQADLVGAFVSGGTVYASTNALYLAAPQYTYNRQGYAEYGTQVHMFSLGNDRSRPAYVASGKVDGGLLNQFSMSEHNGDLRIATTDWNWSGDQQQGGNHLFVMRPYGRELRTIGALRGLAKGERIYSGRMMGDKGYLVTFRQTDPLFTLDLSDPFRPRVVGELKINGFSSYIHPMGDDLLLTIGQDATDQGRVTGLHLQVFDVKDPSRPTRRFHEKVALEGQYSSSVAQYDHHAFMYDPVTSTLAFPVSLSGNGEWFNGLQVYSLDKKRGFRAKGRLDHGALADVQFEVNCENLKKQNPQHAQAYCTDAYRKQARMSYPVTRSMVVDKYILSLSQMGLEIHELADLDVAATLSWAKVEKANPIIAR